MKNIVLIVMDTARYDIVTDNDSKLQNIHSVRQDGTTFTSAFANAPWSLPSHASLFSSQFPSNHGTNATAKRFHPDTPTIAEIFSQNGYETVGISNNSWISNEFGFDRGFDKFIKNWQYIQSDTDFGEIARLEDGLNKGRKAIRRLFNGNPIVNALNAVYGLFQRERGDDGAKKTNNWIKNWMSERDRTEPFFLFINYLEPHLEYRPPKEYAEDFLGKDVTYTEAMRVNQDAFRYIAGDVNMSARDFEILTSLYQAELKYLDDHIGEVRDILKSAREWEDTVFVITGDHGENIGEHGLMDHQYCLYDTLLHIPLIINGGSFSGGRVNEQLVQLTDLAPTLIDAAGIQAQQFKNTAQGSSFHPDVESTTREYIFAEYMAPQPSMEALKKRVGDLPDEVYTYDRSLRAIRGENWKLITGSDGSIELYNTSDDPWEETDLSDEKLDTVKKLKENLNSWNDSFENSTMTADAKMSSKTKNRLEELGYLQ